MIERNQCAGCQAQWPIDARGFHRRPYHNPHDWPDRMSCQAPRYGHPIPPSTEKTS